MRVLVFGDSITQGYWDVSGGWVDKLRQYYDELQFADLQGRDEPTIFNLGISADTSADVLGRIEAETLARTRHDQSPAIVLQIGVNDSALHNGEHQVTIQQYKQNLRAIIEKGKGFGSDLIFIGSSACNESQTIPVAWDSKISYTNRDIKSYEQAMSEIALENNVIFVPIFDLFTKQLEIDTTILPDGLHPDARGHEIIFDIVKPEIINALKELT